MYNYAQASLRASSDAGTGLASPFNWEIDEAQETLLQQWAESKHLWFANAEADIELEYGPMIAQGVERISAQHLDETEDLTCHVLHRSEVLGLLQRGEILQALMAAPLWKYFYDEGLKP